MNLPLDGGAAPATSPPRHPAARFALIGLAVFMGAVVVPLLGLATLLLGALELRVLALLLAESGALAPAVFGDALALGAILLAAVGGAWLACLIVWRRLPADAPRTPLRRLLFLFSRGYFHAGAALLWALGLLAMLKAFGPGEPAALSGAVWLAATMLLLAWLPGFVFRQTWRLARRLLVRAARLRAGAAGVALASVLLTAACWALAWPGAGGVAKHPAAELLGRVFATLADDPSIPPAARALSVTRVFAPLVQQPSPDSARIVLGRIANEASDREVFDEIPLCPLRLRGGYAGQSPATSRPAADESEGGIVASLSRAAPIGYFVSTAPSSDVFDTAVTPFDQCVQALYRAEGGRCAPVDRVGYALRREFGLSAEHAQDVVLDRLLHVCMRHAQQTYDDLATTFWAGARRVATSPSPAPQRLRTCAPEDAQPAHPEHVCWGAFASVDLAHFDGERALLKQLRCDHLSDAERQVLAYRIGDNLRFSQIDALVPTPDKHAKDVYPAVVKRLRRLLDQNRCARSGR